MLLRAFTIRLPPLRRVDGRQPHLVLPFLAVEQSEGVAVADRDDATEKLCSVRVTREQQRECDGDET